LIVLHVLESRHRYSGHVLTEDGEVWASSEVLEKLQHKLREYYLMRVEQESPDFIRFVVRAGVPWVEILRTAKKHKVDLIVMGPYTVRGSVLKLIPDQLRLGGNAQSVSLRARCPVSIVTSPKQRLALKAMET
jgi:nucleotide-binding universal stress UspA family protein